MNQLFDNNITLERESHRYNLATNPELEFTSATTFVSQFFEKFDAEKVAKKLVASSPKYMGMTVEDLLGLWKDSATYGTLKEVLRMFVGNDRFQIFRTNYHFTKRIDPNFKAGVFSKKFPVYPNRHAFTLR